MYSKKERTVSFEYDIEIQWTTEL